MILLQNKINFLTVIFLILFLSYKNTFTKKEDLTYKSNITTKIKSNRILSNFNLKELKYKKLKEYDDLKKNIKEYKDEDRSILLYNLINKHLQKYDLDEYLYHDRNANEKYMYYKKYFGSQKDTENMKRKIRKIFNEYDSKYLLQSNKKKYYKDYIKKLFYILIKKEKKKTYEEIKKQKNKDMSDFDIFHNGIYTIIFTILSITCLVICFKVCGISAVITVSSIISIMWPIVIGIIGVVFLNLALLFLFKIVSFDEYESEDNYEY
ncbi:Plasmodium exported protein, unknown function [Plasmodium sp. gorilla clade G2]|uniref:Plasmodium exported protein, unknown function n=1 Tax=Plasmodium sp. gorilla clade G2 TaxID=880535 RepID=UPI000D2B6A73|nr:Plasmodium exported protein, unknown function [Plasmodium sp. gorilla clade G2]SOV20094.1 Plasmodium exported protein, unknown function [Plasmodium sp. gorilla clade G2]